MSLSWSLDRVRTRLLAAFGVLLVAAIALALVGWYGMRSTQQALVGVEDELLPNISQALELAQRTTQLAALARRLGDSASQAELDDNRARVQALLAEIEAQAEALRPTPALAAVLPRLRDGVASQLVGLVDLTQRSLAAQGRLAEQITALDGLGSRLHHPSAGRLDPAVAALWSTLVLGSVAPDAAELGRYQADAEAWLIAAQRRHALSKLPAPLSASLVELAGPEGLLASRQHLVDLKRASDYLVLHTRADAEELSSEVSRHVAELRGTAAERSRRVHGAIRFGEGWMIALALGCLAIAIGAARYVRRLVGEIETITDVMSRLAQGDTAQRTPATARRDELGALARSFEVFRDHELQRQQAQKLETLGQLTGGVAHDFNNYLGTMLGNLALIEGELSSSPRAHAQWQRVQRAARSAAELTRRLLAFARRQPLTAEQVALDEMVEEMRDLIEYSAGENVNVLFELASAPGCVHLDRGQLENALLNLTMNSAAAMPHGGTLTVRTERLPGHGHGRLAVSVVDTGTGMSEDLRRKVFEPFFTTKPIGEGSGLGLSIVYGFVKQSGGEITLDSRPGEGTRVTLAFPAVEPAAVVSAAGAGHLHAALRLPSGRVLVVDDDEAFRATLIDTLAHAGADARGVANAEAALAALVADPLPDLVLSDICLGGERDGLRLAAELRERWPALTVLLMSGLPPELSPRAPATWPAGVGFLQKPFTLAALRDAWHAACPEDVSRVEQHS